MKKPVLIYFKDHHQIVIHLEQDKNTENKINYIINSKGYRLSDVLVRKVMDDIPLAYHHCYKYVNNKLTLNKESVIKCKINMLRNRRDEILKSLDLPYMIAAERDDTKKKTALMFQRQMLRDLPSKINLDHYTIEQIFYINLLI